MFIYIFKSICCLLVLLVFYKLFLEDEKAHTFKRFYLLGSLVLSICLPLITFSYTTEIPAASEIIYSASSTSILPDNTTQLSGIDHFKNNTLPILFLVIYSCGVLFFGYRFYHNLLNIGLQIKNNQQLNRQSYILVLLVEKLTPHTFLNYIFLNKKEFRERKIHREILLHEKAHVDQKHSLDVLLIELFQVLFWINPLFIWLKKATKLNHEFLADEKVISEVQNASQYSDILFQYAGGPHQVSLSSSINYSLTKKRIIMISKTFSIRKFLVRLGLFLPVLGCCLFLFTNDIVAKPMVVPINKSTAETAQNDQFKDTSNNKQELQQETLFSIKVKGDKLWVNRKETKLKDFSKLLDNLTENWTEEKLKNSNFHMQTKNSDTAFMNQLNKEFKKTRLSKVTGREILPPPPPMPPRVGQAQPSFPANIKANMPPPPPPPIPAFSEDSLNSIHQRILKEHKIISEELKKVEELRNNQELNRRELKIKRAEMQDRLAEARMRMRTEQITFRKEMESDRQANSLPPLPPSPLEAIESIAKDGGSFLYNGEKIDSQKAKELIEKNDNIQIRVYGTKGKTSIMEITDN